MVIVPLRQGNANRADTCGGKDHGQYINLNKGNVMETETYSMTETKLKRIAWLSKQDPEKRFSSLMHLFNQESLTICFHELDGKKAVGIDRVDKESYGKDLYVLSGALKKREHNSQDQDKSKNHDDETESCYRMVQKNQKPNSTKGNMECIPSENSGAHSILQCLF